MVRQCPLCKRPVEVKINRKKKPYLRCDCCGVLMFVNKPEGARILNHTARPTKPVEKEATTAANFLFNS